MSKLLDVAYQIDPARWVKDVGAARTAAGGHSRGGYERLEQLG